MSRKVGIVGAGQSKFGNRYDANVRELSAESFVEAFEKTENLEKDDIEFASIGSAGAGQMYEEALTAPMVCEYLGLNPIGTQRTEAACATGSAAVHIIYNMIASGQIDVGLALGVEKMTEVTTPLMMEFIGRAGSYLWEFENFGPTFPSYYAMLTTAHMDKCGTTEEDIARVSVKNHHYGNLNEKSYLRKEIDKETAMNSDIVAWPLKLYYCCPINDGSASVIMASEEKAKEMTDDPVWITGLGSASSSVNLCNREELYSIKSARVAAKQAYDMGGVGPEDIDVANVHDCFESAEIIAYEDLGFCEEGEGKELIREEQTYADGDYPVNLDGGLKSKGHPLGATGTSMISELNKQLREEVKEKERQAPIDNGTALAHNVGGTGHYTYVTILER